MILGKQGPLAIDLRNGFVFTTGAAGTTKDQYPKVTSVTLGGETYTTLPTAGSPPSWPTSVPTDVTLVLQFSESMQPASVDLSTLRITDVTGGGGSEASFDIQIQEAIGTSLIDVSWNDPAHTEVRLTLNSPILVSGNEYKLDRKSTRLNSSHW